MWIFKFLKWQGCMYTFWSVISKILKKNPNYLEIELKMIVLPDGIHLCSLLVDKPKKDCMLYYDRDIYSYNCFIS